jgi:hypothetical protein
MLQNRIIFISINPIQHARCAKITTNKAAAAFRLQVGLRVLQQRRLYRVQRFSSERGPRRSGAIPARPEPSSHDALRTPHTGAAARLPRPAMRRSHRHRGARSLGMAWRARYRGMLLLAASIAASRLRTRTGSGTQPGGSFGALRSSLVSADMRGARVD